MSVLCWWYPRVLFPVDPFMGVFIDLFYVYTPFLKAVLSSAPSPLRDSPRSLLLRRVIRYQSRYSLSLGWSQLPLPLFLSRHRFSFRGIYAPELILHVIITVRERRSPSELTARIHIQMNAFPSPALWLPWPLFCPKRFCRVGFKSCSPAGFRSWLAKILGLGYFLHGALWGTCRHPATTSRLRGWYGCYLHTSTLKTLFDRQAFQSGLRALAHKYVLVWRSRSFPVLPEASQNIGISLNLLKIVFGICSFNAECLSVRAFFCTCYSAYTYTMPFSRKFSFSRPVGG